MSQKADNIAKRAVMKASTGDRVFQTVINALTVIIAIICLYPLIYAVSASLSKPINIMAGKVVLWPVDFSV